MKNEILTDRQLEAAISGIERQLAKPLKKLGKVRLPRRSLSSLQRDVSVESATGSTIRISVRHEHIGGFHMRPTGLYAVLVQEVRTADNRVKYRARDFTGLSPQLTEEQVTDIVACVKKHLAAAEVRTREVDARLTQSERSERVKAAREAGLRSILKRNGIREGALSIACEGTAFNVRLRLEEDELEHFLKYWKSRGSN